MIPHNKPFLSKKSYQGVKKTFKSGWINYGEISKDTEKTLSNIIYKNEQSARLTVNGTSALFLALKVLGIKKDDEVIIPTYTCTALLNAINLLEARPVICDVSKKNLSFTKKLLIPHITKRTKAIIVVHTFGIPCKIKKIKELNIPIIEDCSQSLGSKYKDGTIVGSFGDISIFSFYASKLITGGIGGAITSPNPKIIELVDDYLNFDTPKTYKPRFNFLISDINASIILAGLKELNHLLVKKQKISNKYQSKIKSQYNSIKGQNHYRFLLKFETYEDLEKCQNFLLTCGIKTILPIEKFELLHNYLKLDKHSYPNAESIASRVLSIPIFPSLTPKEINYIKRSLRDYFSTSTCI